MDAYQELDNLFVKIQESREALQVLDNITLEELMKLCDYSTKLTSVIEVSKYSISIVHNNKNANDFLKLTNHESVKLGFNFFLKVIHPENLGSVYLLIKFFNDIKNSYKIFSNTYFVKSKDGWKWVYNCMKPVTFNQDGSVKYILSVSSTLKDCSETKQQRQQVKKNLKFFEDNIEKYLSMTNQEKEVLKLIGDGLTYKEIAEKLSISTIIVEINLKSLIKKFEVNNTIGLLKFALHFKMV